MGSLLSLVTGWKGYAAVALACLLAGSFGTYKIMHNANLAAQTKVLQRRIVTDEHRGKITFDIAMNFEAPRLKIQQDTQQRLIEVDLHVNPEVDREFPVPCGFVRVFNAATHGPLPDPTGCPDGAASDIALSAVGKTETINDGQYDLISEQLKALQEWVRQQQAVKP